MIIRFKKGEAITYTNKLGETHTATVIGFGKTRMRVELRYMKDGTLVAEKKFVKPERCAKIA